MTKPRKKCRAQVRKYVQHHFPGMKGVKPSVSSRNHAGRVEHRFTFRKALRSSDGERFQQIVHLTTDEEGNVVKVSVSR
jgi:hypothetical protein